MRGDAARPVAIFDSGVGGLTVFQAVRRRLPREHLVYFGDTAHLPYGNKSPGTVTRLVLTHARFLVRRRVKLIVVACNTASAVALGALRRAVRVPVLGVIEPGVREALRRTRSGRVGVAGTATTIGSGAYQQSLAAAGGRRLRVYSRACPLFVPLAEEGMGGHAVTRLIAREYLGGLKGAGVDAVILGCTHYPHLKRVLRAVLGPGIALVDSADAVARALGRVLEMKGLIRKNGGRGREVFYLTDTGGNFRAVAERFLGRPLGRLVKVDVALRPDRDFMGGKR